MPSVHAYICRSLQSSAALRSYAARLLPGVSWGEVFEEPLEDYATPFAQHHVAQQLLAALRPADYLLLASPREFANPADMFASLIAVAERGIGLRLLKSHFYPFPETAIKPEDAKGFADMMRTVCRRGWNWDAAADLLDEQIAGRDNG